MELGLLSLCSNIADPPHPGRGPKPKPLRAVTYACLERAWSERSARNLPNRGAHYNTVLMYASSPRLTPVLRKLANLSDGLLERLRKPAQRWNWKPLAARSAVGRRNEVLMREIVENVYALVTP